MRPLLALILAALVLLGVHSYLRFADALRQRHVVEEQTVVAPGNYSADITLTFAAEADSFALDRTSLLLQLQGHALLKRDGLVPAGVPLRLESLPNIVVGKNAFHFTAIPKESEQGVAKAARIRIFRDGELIAEQTLWAEPGLPPQGEILVDVPSPVVAINSHDHS